MNGILMIKNVTDAPLLNLDLTLSEPFKEWLECGYFKKPKRILQISRILI